MQGEREVQGEVRLCKVNFGQENFSVDRAQLTTHNLGILFKLKEESIILVQKEAENRVFMSDPGTGKFHLPNSVMEVTVRGDSNDSQRREGAERQLNPVGYYAPYFGYNIHMDKNEKLVDFGIVFVMAVDGKSGFIPSFAVMPAKNNITIYREVYLDAIKKYGLWEQVIVNGGGEFYLTLFMQQHYRERSSNHCQRVPYLQVKSTANLRIKRLWVEVNKRVGFPIKQCLMEMEETQGISCDDPTTLFAVSRVVGPVARYGLEQFVGDWNNHSIPAKGIPASFVDSRENLPLPSLVDDAAAVELYEAAGTSSSSSIRAEYSVGEDPLSQTEREVKDGQYWDRMEGGIQQAFGDTVNGKFETLQNMISTYMSDYLK